MVDVCMSACLFSDEILNHSVMFEYISPDQGGSYPRSTHTNFQLPQSAKSSNYHNQKSEITQKAHLLNSDTHIKDY
jgi:hypothetical protein